MKNVNRIVTIVVLLIAIVVSGLVITKIDSELRDTASQVAVLEMQMTDLENTFQSFQTTTTQEIDQLTTTIDTLERLVNDLWLQVVN